MRLTIAVPAAHVADANHLAMVLAEGPPDALTYGVPSWQDADGNLYSVASVEAGPTFVGVATSALARPEWDTTQFISMAAATRAQALIVLASEPQAATPAIILAMPGADGIAALTGMGLMMTDLVEALSGGNVVLMLLLTAVMGLFWGLFGWAYGRVRRTLPRAPALVASGATWQPMLGPVRAAAVGGAWVALPCGLL